MVRKKIIPLVLAVTLSLSVSLLGCKNDDNADSTSKNNTTNKTDNSTTNNSEDNSNLADDTEMLFDKVTDNKMDYTSDKLKESLDKAGYKLEEVDENDSWFSVDVHTYKINDDKLYIYEYKETDTDTMKKDINSITNNGAKINDKDINWEKAPHVYKKGRVLTIYDGENTEVLTALKEALGNPILG